MAIRADTLRSARGSYRSASAQTITEAKQRGIKTIFLCHSTSDRELAQGLIDLLASQGLVVYVDWTDPEMPVTPDRTTATRIQQKIRDTDVLLFLATSRSMSSRWCPWEIGYADGMKGHEAVVVVPVLEGGVTYGGEYLQLYRRIDTAGVAGVGLFVPGRQVAEPWNRL